MVRKAHIILSVFAVAITLGLLQACAPKKSLSPQASCNFVENSESQRISWGPNVPVVMYIDKSVPAAYYSAVQAAMNEWNKSIGKEVLQLGGVINESSEPVQDGKNVIYFMNDWDVNKTYEQARTTVYWTDERISEADIRVNTRDFSFSASDVPVVGEVDFQSLMIHEMGHVLGLAHTSVNGSVMVKSLPAAEGRLPSDVLRRTVSDFDLSSIHCEY